MNLSRMLAQRAEQGRPVAVGLIGAGKFGAMFLAQARRTPGLHLLGIADLDPGRAERTLAETGWPVEQCLADDLDAARQAGTTRLLDDAEALIAGDGPEVVIDATGSPAAGIRHARLCRHHGKHLVMVNVEADVLAGPLLAREFEKAGLVYSMAYGDQPALICELVDWARACGLPVVAAGKGTKYLPSYHASTPETVWHHYGLSPERAQAAGMNSKMFNSFLDGTKSAIEMAAVANATGLAVPADGLAFPPAGVDDLAEVLRPQDEGGGLTRRGQVEVVSSLYRDGTPVPRDLRWGVYVGLEAPDGYVAGCFRDYGLATDDSGRTTALYRPYHLIGLELGVSVASAALRGEPTGMSRDFRGDVVAVAKRDLVPGEVLDGEGGHCVWGRLMPAADSLKAGALPIGLSDGVALRAPVARGEVVTAHHVVLDDSAEAVRTRREMESVFGPGLEQAGGA